MTKVQGVKFVSMGQLRAPWPRGLGVFSVNCVCCGAILDPNISTPRLSLQACRVCGTYRAEHEHVVQLDVSEPWHSVDVSPAFLQSLAERRAIQSRLIIRHFQRTLADGPILDYGCGQGVMVKALTDQGFHVMGCDLSFEVTGAIDRGRFITLREPWSLPDGIDFRTVLLLDVLEHTRDPATFIAQLKDRGAQHFLVKVPMAAGPIFLLAKTLALLGSPDMIEKLFLVGDVFPHLLYFSAEGLARLFERSGFRFCSRLPMAEIGGELPRRIRQI